MSANEYSQAEVLSSNFDFDTDAPGAGTGDWGLVLDYRELATWIPDHLHWVGPSSIYYWGNGDFVFFAKTLSNQRRTSIIEAGRTFYANVEYKFYFGSEPKPRYVYQKCVVKLPWKEKVEDYRFNWREPNLIEYFKQASRVDFVRHWYPDSTESSTPIPLPPIPLP